MSPSARFYFALMLLTLLPMVLFPIPLANNKKRVDSKPGSDLGEGRDLATGVLSFLGGIFSQAGTNFLTFIGVYRSPASVGGEAIKLNPMDRMSYASGTLACGLTSNFTNPMYIRATQLEGISVDHANVSLLMQRGCRSIVRHMSWDDRNLGVNVTMVDAVNIIQKEKSQLHLLIPTKLGTFSFWVSGQFSENPIPVLEAIGGCIFQKPIPLTGVVAFFNEAIWTQKGYSLIRHGSSKGGVFIAEAQCDDGGDSSFVTLSSQKYYPTTRLCTTEIGCLGVLKFN